MTVFLAFFLLTVSLPAAAQDAKKDPYVVKAQEWLSDLKTAEAKFDQIDNQGNVLHGTFYISRPGRLRFEYDDPIKDYIVADGYLIHFFDAASGQASSAPIGSTLADFILRDGNRFDEKVKVDSITDKGDAVSIALSQAGESGTGQLIMNFRKNPFELSSWKIIDPQGLTTDIILYDMQRVASLSPELFRMDNLNLND